MEGEDPNNYGFSYDQNNNSDMKEYLAENIVNEAFVQEICDELRKKDIKWVKNHNLEWFLSYDYKAEAIWYPSNLDIYGSKVIIYGAGDVGRAYLKYIRCKYKVIELLIVDERYVDVNEVDNCKVYSPSSINSHKYDCVLIAIYDDKAREEVKMHLINDFDVERNLIYAEKPKKCFGGIEFATTL